MVMGAVTQSDIAGRSEAGGGGGWSYLTWVAQLSPVWYRVAYTKQKNIEKMVQTNIENIIWYEEII